MKMDQELAPLVNQVAGFTVNRNTIVDLHITLLLNAVVPGMVRFNE
jgi:hypothetical protein